MLFGSKNSAWWFLSRVTQERKVKTHEVFVVEVHKYNFNKTQSIPNWEWIQDDE